MNNKTILTFNDGIVMNFYERSFGIPEKLFAFSQSTSFKTIKHCVTFPWTKRTFHDAEAFDAAGSDRDQKLDDQSRVLGGDNAANRHTGFTSSVRESRTVEYLNKFCNADSGQSHCDDRRLPEQHKSD